MVVVTTVVIGWVWGVDFYGGNVWFLVVEVDGGGGRMVQIGVVGNADAVVVV